MQQLGPLDSCYHHEQRQLGLICMGCVEDRVNKLHIAISTYFASPLELFLRLEPAAGRDFSNSSSSFALSASKSFLHMNIYVSEWTQ